MATQTIDVLKANVKALVVMAKSRVASVVEMKAMKQQPDEKAEAFLARLKSTARRIGFKLTKRCGCGCNKDVEVDYTDEIIRDEFIAGIFDDESRGELMKRQRYIFLKLGYFFPETDFFEGIFFLIFLLIIFSY